MIRLITLTLAALHVAAPLVLADSVPLRFGLPMSACAGDNLAEAKIATKVFLKHAFSESEFAFEGTVFKEDDEMFKALEAGHLDFIAMDASLYLRRGQDLPILPVLTTQRGESPTEILLLVAAKGKPLSSLKGRSLLVDSSARSSTPKDWVTDHLLKSGSGEAADQYFSSISERSSASKALLPVYFGRADAAVLSVADYELMCQHNPDIRNRLHTVCRSKPLATSVVCYSPGFTANRPSEVTRVLQGLGRSEDGARFLKHIGARRFVPFKEDYLLNNREIANRVASIKPGAEDEPLAGGDSQP